jgi:hypothetical protein
VGEKPKAEPPEGFFDPPDDDDDNGNGNGDANGNELPGTTE